MCRSDDDVTRHCFFERYDGDVHGGPFFRGLQDLNSINDSAKPLLVNILKVENFPRHFHRGLSDVFGQFYKPHPSKLEHAGFLAIPRNKGNPVSAIFPMAGQISR